MSTRQLVTLDVAVVERPWAASTDKDPTRWLRRLVSEHRLRYYKAGGRVLVDLDDLDAFAAAGRVEAAPGLSIVGNRRASSRSRAS